MLGQHLGHYRIDAKLGAGGMGEVYRAHDEHLHRSVAIKVLPSGTLATDAERKRFRQEALALSALNHPNIETVYDFDTQDGRDFLVMEYLSGETLSEKLGSGSTPESEVVRLACQLAEGLAAAHAQRIIHRDLKPTNLMVTPEGRLKILDFGLAKLRRPVDDKGVTESATGTGIVMGTLPYMAPEQVRSDPVDVRTDIYAVGVVLYELSTGQRPFGDAASLRLADAILHKPCVPPARLRPGLSPALEAVILKCLQKDPGRRYRSVADLLLDLHRLADRDRTGPAPLHRRGWHAPAAAVLGLLMVGGLLFWRARGGGDWAGPTMGPEKPSVAVLPLKNLSGDPQQDYFSDGITEDIISQVAKIPGVKVISRTSVEQYKQTNKNLREIGRELGVATVMEGSVRRAANRVRIVAQLIDARTDAHLWAETYDRELSDIFAVQSDVARQIAGALRTSLSPATVELLSDRPTANLEAYDLYLRATQYVSDDDRELRARIQLLEQAVKLDPTFAAAWGRLAESHARMWWFHWDRAQERVRQAKAAVDRALELRPDLPDARRALAFYYYHCLLDYPRAVEEFSVTLKGRPGDSRAWAGLGWVKRRQGKLNESLADQLKALEFEPRSQDLLFNLGETYALLRKFEEADKYYDRSLILKPDHYRSYAYKVRLRLLLKSDLSAARAILKQANAVGLDAVPWIVHHWVLLEIWSGDYEAALKRLAETSSEAFSDQFWFIPRALLQAQVLDLAKQPAAAREQYEAARRLLEARIRQDPKDSRYHSSLGIALAGLGRKAEAVRSGQRGVELLPLSQEAYRGTYRVEDLARIHVVVGEPEAAIDRLEQLLSIPGDLGPAALQLDPTWKPLHGHPRFRQLLASAAH